MNDMFQVFNLGEEICFEMIKWFGSAITEVYLWGFKRLCLDDFDELHLKHSLCKMN